MKKHVPVVVIVAFAACVLAGVFEPAAADVTRLRAWVFPDRAQPEMAVVVDDFRVNETVWDYGGVQYIWLHGPAGAYKVPLAEVSQIEALRFVRMSRADWARYEVKVSEKEPGIVHTGEMEIRVLRGVADGEAWYYYPATLADRGARFWRVVLGDVAAPPTVVPPSRRAEPAPDYVLTRPRPVGELPAEPDAAAEELADVLFDFDRSDIRADAEATLQRNAAWLGQRPGTVVRIEGYADPRGTLEYNEALGLRRAESVRQFLVRAGVDGARLQAVSRGRSQLFCVEASEACWAQNRRAHFVVVPR